MQEASSRQAGWEQPSLHNMMDGRRVSNTANIEYDSFFWSASAGGGCNMPGWPPVTPATKMNTFVLQRAAVTHQVANGTSY